MTGNCQISFIKPFRSMASWTMASASRSKSSLGLVKELGTAGTLDSSKLVLVGSFSNSLLNDKVGKYVKEYVTCRECGKQDTLLLREDRILFLKCEACGAKRPVPNV